MKAIHTGYSWGLGFMILFSCNGFLDEKPQKSLLVPETTEEIRALLDSYDFLNLSPLTVFLMSDEWETTSQDWETYDPWQQNAYLWKGNIFDPQERSSDYQTLHGQLFYANTCLDLVEKPENGPLPELSAMKGEALAVRARVLFDLALMFLPGPQSSLASQVKIPVNLTPDINAPLRMISVEELLAVATEDLTMAFDLLPVQAEVRTRPDKRVAMGLLSRIYLYGQNWDKAMEAAGYVIGHSQGLMDYKELDPSASYPFGIFNKETVFFQQMQTSVIPLKPTTRIAGGLYGSYQDNDLRKSLFFKKSPTGAPLFRGSYTGGFRLFSGIGLSEMYLTAAESAIRTGELEEGLLILNELGASRYSEFHPWENLSQQEALELVLAERSRELVFRNLRWMDMKRANYLDRSFYAQREINGSVYTLDSEVGFILELPPYEVELGLK